MLSIIKMLLPGRSFSQSVHFVAVKHCVDIGLGVGEEHALASEAESVGLVESFELVAFNFVG